MIVKQIDKLKASCFEYKNSPDLMKLYVSSYTYVDFPQYSAYPEYLAKYMYHGVCIGFTIRNI